MVMCNISNPSVKAHPHTKKPQRSIDYLKSSSVQTRGSIHNRSPPIQADGIQSPSSRQTSAIMRRPKRKESFGVPPSPQQNSKHGHPCTSKKRKCNGNSPTSTPTSDSRNQDWGKVSDGGDALSSTAQRETSRFDVVQSYQSPQTSTTDISIPYIMEYPQQSNEYGFCTSHSAANQFRGLPWNHSSDFLPSVPPPEPPGPRVQLHLQDLPPEILHRVCEHLEKEDVKNFRLTAEIHADIGDEHMFRQGILRLQIDADHFERLRKMSENPMICRAIKLLEISGYRHAFAKLVNHVAFQTRFRLNGRYYSDSVECIGQFRNLKTVEMRINIDRVALLDPSWRRNLSRQMHGMLSDIQSLPCIHIRYLKYEGVGWQSPCCVGAHLSPDAFNFKVFENAAERLLRLELTMTPQPSDPEMNRCQALVHYLQYARNLEEIKLTLGKKEGVPFYASLDDFLRLRLSRLRSMDISFGTFAELDLLSFLVVHSALKELRLGFMILREGTWTTAVGTMAQILPSLNKISFWGQLSDTRLMESRTTLCGESLNSWAHRIAVLKQPGLNVAYPANPLAVALAAAQRDRQAQRARRAAGLHCPLCESCGQIEHT